MQKNLDRIENFTTNNQMKINPEKSKVMIFNKSRKYDFPPELSFQDGKILECLEDTKLLGVHLSADLRWNSNTSVICGKAMSKMWLLRRLKKFHLDHEVILDYYLKEIRPLVEHGVPIWNSGLTKAQVRELENVQKVALKIILDDSYYSYDVACTLLNILPLQYRRTDLCTNFAVKLYKSPRSSEFFQPAENILNTRSEQLLVTEKMSNTRRCFNAPHNYLARLVNKNRSKIVNSKS